MDLTKKENDYIFGKSEEDKLYKTIKATFSNDLERTKERYDRYDYISNNYKIELKSRAILSTDYKEVYISYSKIDFYKNNYSNSHKLILVFNYIDKLLYIQYDDEIFKNFKINHQNTRRDYKYIDTVIYIPINLLKEIKK